VNIRLMGAELFRANRRMEGQKRRI